MSAPTPGSFLKEHDGFVLKLKIKSPDGKRMKARKLKHCVEELQAFVRVSEIESWMDPSGFCKGFGPVLPTLTR